MEKYYSLNYFKIKELSSSKDTIKKKARNKVENIFVRSMIINNFT